ncbi:MAG TPA: NepR family anti-sigma factor [Methylocella sp.]|nr:NepR family anti-sigma factor [Methylocella sp.]
MSKSADPKIPQVKEAGIKSFEGPDPAAAPCSKTPQKDKECGSKKSGAEADITDQIGVHLRSVYDDILAQPVPGRFFELLRQLEKDSAVQASKESL